jgi:ParB-like chromosome segregation protein Spo0J
MFGKPTGGVKMNRYQFLPSLSLDEYEALRESIRKYGVIQPVIVDENNAVIDGYHRVKVCKELEIEYPTRVIEGLTELTEEEKENLSVSLNIKRHHLTKEQKKELALALREQGWTQERIASVFEVTQQTICNWFKNTKICNTDQSSPIEEIGSATPNGVSQMGHPDQPSPNPSSEDREKTELKKQVAYYEELARQDEKVRQEAIEREVKLRVAEMEEKRERRREAEASRQKLNDRLEYEGKMQGEFKEKEAKLQREFEIKESALQARIDAKMKQIGEASKLKVDVTSLQKEQRILVSELAGLRLEIEQEKESLNVREQMKKALGAGLASATVMGLVDKMISKSSDFCGLSVEDMERYIGKLEEIVSYSNESINTLRSLMERAPQRGGLRVVR